MALILAAPRWSPRRCSPVGSRRPLHGGLTLLALRRARVSTPRSRSPGRSRPPTPGSRPTARFAYVATFAGALALVRLAPGRWAAVLNGIALGCLLVCGWALLTKVFPERARGRRDLRPPARAVRLLERGRADGGARACRRCCGSRRGAPGNPAANALAWPALGLLFACMMLSYSRGALLALLLGLAFWFAVVPLRLRGARLPLVAAAVAAAPVVALGVRARRALDRPRAARRARRRRPRARRAARC